jgi:hypothetical protein
MRVRLAVRGPSAHSLWWKVEEEGEVGEGDLGEDGAKRSRVEPVA